MNKQMVWKLGKVGAVLGGILTALGAVADVNSLWPWSSDADKPIAPAGPGVVSANASVGAVAVSGTQNSVSPATNVINGGGNVIAQNGGVVVVAPSASNSAAAAFVGDARGKGDVRDPAQPLYGSWRSDYTYAQSTGTHRVNGLVQYFRNGTYSFTGETETRLTNDSHDYLVVHAATAAGKWQLKGRHLLLEHADMKSTVKRVLKDGEEHPASLILRGLPGARIEAALPMGKGEDFRINSISADTMDLEGVDPQGGRFLIHAVKRHDGYEDVRGRSN